MKLKNTCFLTYFFAKIFYRVSLTVFFMVLRAYNMAVVVTYGQGRVLHTGHKCIEGISSKIGGKIGRNKLGLELERTRTKFRSKIDTMLQF